MAGRKSKIIEAILIVVGIAVIGAFVSNIAINSYRYRKEFRENVAAGSLENLVNKNTPHYDVYLFQSGEETCICWIRPVPRPLPGLISGPSCYIFDRGGKLIDSCFDIGEDPYFCKKWLQFPKLEQVSEPKILLENL